MDVAEVGTAVSPNRGSVRMAILSSRMEGIARKMQNTLFRTARSGVLNTAHDFSCVVLTAAWWWSAHHAAEPVLPPRLFRNPVFSVSAAISFAAGFAGPRRSAEPPRLASVWR